MTKEEQNNIIEQAWVYNLQKKAEDIPADLADKYSAWVQGLIQQSTQLINTQGQATGSEEQPQETPK